MTDRWLSIKEIVEVFGLTEESLRRMARSHGFPLRRITPMGTPGALESEVLMWIKSRPKVGSPVRKPKPAKV